MMQLPDEVVEDVRKRLRRVAGQVQGVERMLDQGRECRDVVTQISAATKALEQAGFRLVAAGLTYCLDNPDEAAADGYPLETVEKMFMKLA
jgi:DNA-binding FrmR family transcriptional regulator